MAVMSSEPSSLVPTAGSKSAQQASPVEPSTVVDSNSMMDIDAEHSSSATNIKQIEDRSANKEASPPASSPLHVNGNGIQTENSNAGSKDITAPPSPPIPTPPLQISTEAAQEPSKFSELSITSPPLPSNSAGHVDQLTSGIRASPKPVPLEETMASNPPEQTEETPQVEMTDPEHRSETTDPAKQESVQEASATKSPVPANAPEPSEADPPKETEQVVSEDKTDVPKVTETEDASSKPEESTSLEKKPETILAVETPPVAVEKETIAEAPAAAAAVTAPADVDSEMMDAPAVSPPAAKPLTEPSPLAGKTRGRDDSGTESDEPPMKRAKTEDDEEMENAPPALPAKTDDLAQPEAMNTDDAPAPSTTVEAGTSTTTTTVQGTGDRPPMPKHQQRFCLSMVRNMKRLKDAGPFVLPVDHVKLNIPHYYDIIKEPMDLTTIEKKLNQSAYPSTEEFKADFKLIIANTIKFNGEEHTVTQMGRNLEAHFERSLKSLPPVDQVTPLPKSKKKGGSSATRKPATPVAAAEPVVPAPAPVEEKAPVAVEPVEREPSPKTTSKVQTPPPPPPPKVNTKVRRESMRSTAKSPTAASPTFSLQPSGMPLIRRDSTATTDGRPKRPIHPPPSRDLPYSDMKPRRKKAVAELKFCDTILKELLKKQHEGYAFPFYQPVDPVALNIPDYFKIVRKPMDLSSIQTKLKGNEYDGTADFEADIRLMFSNCYKFNPADSPVHQMGKKLEAVFDSKWKEKPNFKEPQSESVSPQPEEAEDQQMSEDESHEDIAALQQQLEAMKDRLDKIKKKGKKASPPAQPSKSSHKKKPSVSNAPPPPPKKAAVKEAAPAPAKKKSVSKKKEEKIPYITFEQKQEISEKINSLPPSKMANALRMIQEGMPSLKGVQEEEIELDIDELSNDVLHRLYKYVSKHTSSSKAAPAEPAQQAASSGSKSKQHSSSKPKKNKPMSAVEQEKKIKELQSQLEGYNNSGEAKPQSLASITQVQPDAELSSSDDESSSGSESEEE